MKKKHVKRVLLGYISFFLTIALTVTAVVLIHERVRTNYANSKTKIALIMLAVCFTLSLICSLIDALRRKLTTDRAVEQILEATEKITTGNFKIILTPRHSYSNYDDLDVIMDNLNKMARELSKNEVLKTDFISNVSHEIKTPLAIIQNYSTALQNENLTPEQRSEYIKVLNEASLRLNDLVLNVLKLNKLENQNLSPEKTVVRLEELLTLSVFNFEEAIEKKNLTLECDFDEVSITTSPSYLEIVWNNLLSNAVKFSNENGTIKISLKKENGEAIVKFSDNGCGMNSETGKRIFDKFYQGDTSHAKEGNGLGLALVKKVIALLGGKIKVESKLGKGTTFTVVLKDLDDKR